MQLKNIKDLSIEELKTLGFKKYILNYNEILMLIPDNKLDIIPFGINLYAVDGGKITYNDKHDDSQDENYMDKDTRWGVYAWGIKKSNL